MFQQRISFVRKKQIKTKNDNFDQFNKWQLAIVNFGWNSSFDLIRKKMAKKEYKKRMLICKRCTRCHIKSNNEIWSIECLKRKRSGKEGIAFVRSIVHVVNEIFLSQIVVKLNFFLSIEFSTLQLNVHWIDFESLSVESLCNQCFGFWISNFMPVHTAMGYELWVMSYEHKKQQFYLTAVLKRVKWVNRR